MYSLIGKRGIAILVPILALILMVVSVNPAYAAHLSEADFDGLPIIDFEDSRETWEAIGSRRSKVPSSVQVPPPDLSMRWRDKTILRGHAVQALPRG